MTPAAAPRFERVAPGPSWGTLLAEYPALLRDPLAVVARWRDRFGPAIQLPHGGAPLLLLSSADDMAHILVARHGAYLKRGNLAVGYDVLGQGLVTSNGPLHDRQRRLLSPAFHPRRFENLPATALEVAQRMTASWNEGATVDLARALTRIAFTVLCKTFFSSELEPVLDDLIAAFLKGQRYLQRGLLTPWPHLARLPWRRGYRQTFPLFFETADALVRGRRAAGPRGDMLDALLNGKTEEGRPLPDALIRDEILTFMAAGHETTANAIAWSLWLLARHPAVLARLQKEVDAVPVDGRGPDPRALVYTEQVFCEALRLFPPIYSIGRDAAEPDLLPSGTRIPARSHVVMMTYLVHRDPRAFPEPDRFDPERFAPSRRDSVPARYFLPFGEGPRSCIGEGFATLLGKTLLFFFARSFAWELRPRPAVRPELLIALRPREGVWARISRRPGVGLPRRPPDGL